MKKSSPKSRSGQLKLHPAGPGRASATATALTEAKALMEKHFAKYDVIIQQGPLHPACFSATFFYCFCRAFLYYISDGPDGRPERYIYLNDVIYYFYSTVGHAGVDCIFVFLDRHFSYACLVALSCNRT